MTTRIDEGLPAACRRHRELGVGWDDPPPGGFEGGAHGHAARCTACRHHDQEVARQALELRALAGEPVRDLWPAIAARAAGRGLVARGPGWLVRAAAVLAGLVSVTAALCALDAGRSQVPPLPVASPHRAFAALGGPADHTRVAGAPELQLLALLAPRREESR
ncbi:MAG: hypothetical protein JNK02_13070 [Planctomycetes bacterium]|nr:hypothetical protein [Planctomycetota bacterium]